MIDKILKVAKREYMVTVKTKTFLLGILLLPVVMGGIIFITAKMQTQSFSGPRPDKKLAVINRSGEIAANLDSVFAGYNMSNAQRKIVMQSIDAGLSDEQTIKDEVKNGMFDALLIIDEGVIDNSGRMHLFTPAKIDLEMPSTIQRLANDAIFSTRLIEHDLSPSLVNQLRRWVPVEHINLGDKSEHKKNELATIFVPFFFLFVMFFGIVAISQGLLMSVIEEKTNRVIEVLLAAVSPFELMTGKILGQAAVGLSLVSLYAVAAYTTMTSRGFQLDFTLGFAAYFFVYFILGFLVISSILAAIGSVCNEIKEAQSLMSPFMMIMVIPMISWMYLAQHPENMYAIVLSFIPPLTPMVMIIRIASNPDLPILQIAGSIAVLAAAVPVVFWIAGKVFHTGILMYGKPPSMREIVKWIR